MLFNTEMTHQTGSTVTLTDDAINYANTWKGLGENEGKQSEIAVLSMLCKCTRICNTHHKSMWNSLE